MPGQQEGLQEPLGQHEAGVHHLHACRVSLWKRSDEKGTLKSPSKELCEYCSLQPNSQNQFSNCALKWILPPSNTHTFSDSCWENITRDFGGENAGPSPSKSFFLFNCVQLILFNLCLIVCERLFRMMASCFHLALFSALSYKYVWIFMFICFTHQHHTCLCCNCIWARTQPQSAFVSQERQEPTHLCIIELGINCSFHLAPSQHQPWTYSGNPMAKPWRQHILVATASDLRVKPPALACRQPNTSVVFVSLFPIKESAPEF